ncbi:DUF21 domain-containing protein, partial [Candidatus Peregrinibacteria bacterium]|nr:DUF21 domain-containing protein [Candidatus Peregrinibacteria bacterium]
MSGMIIWLALLIILSGMFSGSETAIISVSDAKIRSLVKAKVRGANTL